MPRPSKGPRLGSSPSHERLILANLATALIEHGSVKTTFTKAKRLSPYVEKLVTKGKRGDLNSRRQVMKVIRDKSAVHMLFTDLAEQFKDRNGGYTRVIKLGHRQGDNAQMAIIEFVTEKLEPKKSNKPVKTDKAEDKAESDSKAENADVEATEAEATETDTAEEVAEENATSDEASKESEEKKDEKAEASEKAE